MFRCISIFDIFILLNCIITLVVEQNDCPSSFLVFFSANTMYGEVWTDIASIIYVAYGCNKMLMTVFCAY